MNSVPPFCDVMSISGTKTFTAWSGATNEPSPNAVPPEPALPPEPAMCGPSWCHGWLVDPGNESMHPKWVRTASSPRAAWTRPIHGASLRRKENGAVESSGSWRS